VPWIIQYSTFQLDKGKEHACQVIGIVVNAVISEAISAGSSVVGGLLQPFQEAGQKLSWTLQSIGKEIEIFDQVTNKLVKTVSKEVNWLTTVTPVVTSQLADLTAKIENTGQEDFQSTAMRGWLRTGMGSNPFCQGFAGSYPNLNDDNYRQLTTVLGKLVDDIREAMAKSWQVAFQGAYPVPGEESFFASMVRYQNFTEIRMRLNQPRDPWVEYDRPYQHSFS
jgi:hypothetical protein